MPRWLKDCIIGYTMIKNLNETLSLLVLIVMCLFMLKVGLGMIFSSHLTGTARGNFELFKRYSENDEE